MKRETIACSAQGQISVLLPATDELPDNIQWCPPGNISCRPLLTDKTGTQRRQLLNFQATPDLAQMFNEQLQDLRADAKDGSGDEPYMDFNHEDRERSAEVTELYWGGDDPIKGGIRARVIWSAAGKAAVLGRNYRRFSPQWGLDKNTLEPICIESNLGGLVNRAAITNIAPVIAKGDSAANHNTTETMTDKEIQDAIANGVAAGLKATNERIHALEIKPGTTTAAARAENQPDIATIVATAVGSAIKPFSDKLTEIENKNVKAQASAAIKPHIARGAIAPADIAGITFWENCWIADAKGAEAQMAKLAGQKLNRIIANASGDRQDATNLAMEPEQQIMATATEVAKASGGKVSLAEALIAQCHTGEGQENYKAFRQTFGAKTNNN